MHAHLPLVCPPSPRAWNFASAHFFVSHASPGLAGVRADVIYNRSVDTARMAIFERAQSDSRECPTRMGVGLVPDSSSRSRAAHP